MIVELGTGREFAASPRNASTGPSAPRGGDLGFFGRGDMVPAFEQAASTSPSAPTPWCR